MRTPLLTAAALAATLLASPAAALPLPPPDLPPVVLPALPALPGLAIPSLPTDALAERYTGAPHAASPVDAPRVPQHPFLSPNGTSSMHNDAYSTDAYDVTGPLGVDPVVTSASYGLRECATATFDSRGRFLGLCGGLEGFVMQLIDPDTLEVLDELPMPGRNLAKVANPFSDICGGTYFFLTEDDRAIATTTTSEIHEVVQTADGTGLALGRTWPLADEIPQGDCLVALSADWAGNVWFVSQLGTVGTLDRDSGRVRTVRLGTDAEPEEIWNSVSSDETGGVYVVTTHATYRLDATADGTPRVTWRAAYDRGRTLKPGQLSQGSGTSPTLIGKRWIAITDNAEPRMNVVVLDRRRGVPAGQRVHCTVPVLDPGASATENSLVAVGRAVVVENNYGYDGVPAAMFGRSTSPGLERVDIGRDGCRSAWRSDETAPTSVPKASLGAGLVYAYTKPARADGVDEWRFTAIDARTGETAWSVLTGTGTQWNNHYAAIYLGPDGTAYVATLSGLVRIEDAG